MCRKIIYLTLLTASYFFSLPALATTYDTPAMKLVVETLEIEKLHITLDQSLNGYVYLDKGKKRLTITPETKAFKDGIEVSLLKARDLKMKYAEVSYDFKTGQVIRIGW